MIVPAILLGVKFLEALMEPSLIILYVRLAQAFLGVLFLRTLIFCMARRRKRERILASLACSAFFVILASEILGRFLFFASYQRIGL